MGDDTEARAIAARLTKAQREALALAARRNWPAGEPRIMWINMSTARVVMTRHKLIEETERGPNPIVRLTPLGVRVRAALVEMEGRG